MMHRIQRLGLLLLLMAMTALGSLLLAVSAQAHTGNISVQASACVSTDSMTATYQPTWDQGTSAGVLYSRPGLVSDSGSWTRIKDISGASGSTTFELTHPKSDFTGPDQSNGPWISFRIVFSDNYEVKGDTRVEGFKWSKCVVIPPKPGDSIVVTYGDWTGPTPTCETPSVTSTRTVTQSTTSYVWDESSAAWILDQTKSVSISLPDETRTSVWPGDLEDCTPQPAPLVTTESRTTCDGGYETQTTAQQYIFDHQTTQSWILGDTKDVSGWVKDRDLSATEKAELGCVTTVVAETAPPVQAIEVAAPELAMTGFSATEAATVAIILLMTGACLFVVFGKRN